MQHTWYLVIQKVKDYLTLNFNMIIEFLLLILILILSAGLPLISLTH